MNGVGKDQKTVVGELRVVSSQEVSLLAVRNSCGTSVVLLRSSIDPLLEQMNIWNLMTLDK